MERLPFEEMLPANHLVKGRAFCLARPGEVYALYLPSGGSVSVELVEGNQYKAEWYDPRTGEWTAGSAVAGGVRTLAAPDGRDWAVRVLRTQGTAVGKPIAPSARISSVRGQSVPVHLAGLGAGGFAYEIVTPPKQGKLDGTDADRTYRPNPGYTGADRFEWRLRGKGWVSNTATVSITVNASGVNTAPRAEDLDVTVTAGQPKTFILPYTDPDGPGPFAVRIVKRPGHGSAEGMDNDITYTPEAGYRGSDEIEWLVSDGEGRSNRAKVRIVVK
jgi:hypothetical protein